MASLSAFLRDMRGKRTQKQVAEGAKIERSAYVNMENEKRGMGEDVAKRLAAYYKKPLKTFEPYITDGTYRLKLIEGSGSLRLTDAGEIRDAIVDLAQAVELLATEQRRQADEILQLRRELAPSRRKARGTGER